jgi:predicted DCC family thiol-disulfide oxidoreductase YuxK
MKERWVLYYDGACPLCTKANTKIKELLPSVKLTSVDLNSVIAISKGYAKNNVVLETPSQVFLSYKAWLKILQHTKYKWATNILIRPLFILFYHSISKNRKLISKIL